MNTIVDYKIHYQLGQNNPEDYYSRSLKYIKYNFKIWNSFSGERYANHTGKFVYYATVWKAIRTNKTLWRVGKWIYYRDIFLCTLAIA